VKEGQKHYNTPVLEPRGFGEESVKSLEPAHTTIATKEQKALTVAESLEQVNHPPERKRTARSAPLLPPPDDDLLEEDSAGEPRDEDAGAATTRPAEAPVSDPDADGAQPESSPAETDDPIISNTDRRRMFAVLRDAGMTDEQIRSLVEQVTGTSSTGQMTTTQLEQVIAAAPKQETLA